MYLIFPHIQGSLAKKPYNPIIGETFHCSWDVGGENGNQASRMLYVAEQVSHHPPGISSSQHKLSY